MSSAVKTILAIVAVLLAFLVAVGLYILPTLGEESDGTAASTGTQISDTNVSSGTDKTDNSPASNTGDKTGSDTETGTNPAASTPVFTESEPKSGAVITFSGSSVAVTGSSAAAVKVEGTAVTISAAGTYTVTGTSSEGSVKVKKGTTGVTLVLKNLDLTCSTTAPVSINKTSKATIWVSGTVTLTDKEDLANDTDSETSTFEGAAIKVKSGASLTVTGSGTLNINGNCKNGIKGAAESVIILTGGVTSNITAANNGLAADGAVAIQSGVVNVNAVNEGIKAVPDDGDAASAGTIYITGGTVTVQSKDKGIQALEINVGGGTLSVTSEDDAFNAAVINVTAGNVTVNTGDDGFHADSTVTFGVLGEEGPNVNIANSHEGIESGDIVLNSGNIYVYGTDDGINAADGSGNNNVSSFGGRGGMSTPTATLTVNGGTLIVETPTGDTDAIDCNGSYIQNGGTVLVLGGNSTGSMAGSVDVDGTITVKGGLIVALGGICETPGSDSVNTVVVGRTAFSAGSYVIKDSKGTEIYSFTLKKTFTGCWISADTLTLNESYTITKDGSEFYSWTQSAQTVGSAGTGSGWGGGFGGGGRTGGRR
ncbi:MAG: carbohydrate-binding domain-containing protein [Oscillospiraceae bacterium]|nr:carbohydrate-binding domain-containing protein [Oscillospiraceae bacterium]